MNGYFKAVRPERWPRSLAIFLGPAAYFFLNRQALGGLDWFQAAWKLSLSFVLTWGISTANYVINEIADMPYDIHHPSKRQRPLIRGEVKKAPFAALGAALAVLCLTAAFFLFSRPFFYSLAALLAAGFIYNIKPIRTKDIPFLDSLSESMNNPIRFFIGWFAFAPAGLFPPVSLLVSWWAFGNLLMVAKRVTEFHFLKDKAGIYRSSHKAYSRTSLLTGMAASAVIFLAAYFWLALAFRLQTFLYISLPLMFLIAVIFRKTVREEEAMEEPEKLFGTKTGAALMALLLILFSLSFFLDKVGQ
ncbi:MAG TPA: UbiA family prenyltransferase [Acidobacteriota bacterium]